MIDTIYILLPLLLGYLADRIFGDPANLPHPVVAFGKLISWGERWLNKGNLQIFKGAVFSVLLILFVFFVSISLLEGLTQIHRGLAIILSIIGVFYCLAGKTLINEVRKVFIAVDSSVEEGRLQVARIVGRDTSKLNPQQIRTAALETLSENLSDGVIAPLFWFMILGLPGMLAYKMINTLDSMIGYKSDRYKAFGCWAARIDDIANYIPARLTAFLMIIVSGRFSLFAFVAKYGRLHASPNSGYPESALAGILNCQFGGSNVYFDKVVDKPYIGTNPKVLDTQDMEIAVGINRKTELLMILLTALYIVFDMKFYVVGIDDNRVQHFSPEISEIIKEHTVFSGGARHREIVSNLLPQNCIWVDIIVPLSKVFEQYDRFEEIVVFASGDPLFFGFANTIRREKPEAEVKLFPYFNSLQLLAHRMLMPYQDMHIVSLTGRPWSKFDAALILGYEKIGVLTDNKEHIPANIAKRMLDYGYDNYKITIGELLGNKEEERVSTFELKDVLGKEFSFPNNLILQKTYTRVRPFGIPESDFNLLNGRVKMITKMPIRLLSLSMLELRERHTFWDIGFCTGSVSVEAKLQFPHLQIIAFEQRDEGRELIKQNSRKFGVPGIQPIIGDFTTIDTTHLLAPDAVFIGGHGGKMREIITKITGVLASGGVIVFNSVSEESKQMFVNAVECNDLYLAESVSIKIDYFNTIEVMKARKIK